MPDLSSKTPDILKSHLYQRHAEYLCASYERYTGLPLLPSASDSHPMIEQLFDAPFALLSHDTRSDPVFNFGNRVALKHFEMSWEMLTQLPSRQSAEPINQEDRARLMAEVTEKGYIDNYSGIRISSTGKRFMINRAIVWNLYDDKGQYYGQAALFHNTEPVI